MKTYTKEQVNKKYKGVYIEITKRYDGLIEVYKTSRIIKENMTLGEDVGTPMEYRR